ncbi:MAG: cyclic-di-AMP receptor [Chloroflexota bacterium]|nr:MAG: hypothetical protein KatS3mg045_0616 [Bellilinea sp.]
MKLILAIVPDTSSEPVSQALTSHNFRVTGIASTGGFLRRGKTTLLIGVEDDQVERALEQIRAALPPQPSDSKESRAVIFVLKVDHFDHF